VYECKSFTDDYIWYDVLLKDGVLHRCNCPDISKHCKHIFLVSRVTDIPFTLTSNLVVAATDDGLNDDTLAAVSTDLVDNNTDTNTTSITTNTSSDYDICLELQGSIDSLQIYL